MSEPAVHDAQLPGLGEAGAFEASPVQIGVERILRIQGYSDPSKVRPRIRKAAQYAAGLAGEITQGAVGFRRLPVSTLDGARLQLDFRFDFQCEAFGRFLQGCDSVVAFVLTAGAVFDEQIDELMKGDRPVEGLFLDSAGWLAVEAVTRQFAEQLKRDAAARGLRLTRRMGPGYSYRMGTRMEPWDLSEQVTLFEALGDAPLPSQLMESSAMHPKMSRSGLYGLRPDTTPTPEPTSD